MSDAPFIPEETEDILTADFSEARDFTPVPAGMYEVVVTGITSAWPRGTSAENPVKANGDPARQMAVIALEFFNIPELANRYCPPFRAALSGEYSGFLLEALKVLVPGFEKGDPIVRSQIVGARAKAEIIEGLYEDRDTGESRVTNNIQRLHRTV